jgi:ubiquinone/menaquinone biosynthesis C-methylase UbiE
LKNLTLGTKESFETLYTNEDPWKIRSSTNLIERLNNIWVQVASDDRKEKIILDCGCGEGIITDYVTKQFGAAIGVDISRKALARAKQKLRHCDFVEADMRQLPFKDKSIDCVSCFETLYYLKNDYGIAIVEFARILSHDGRIILSVHLGKNYFNFWGFMLTLSRTVQKSAIYCLQLKFRCLLENVPGHTLAYTIANHLPSFLARKIVIVCKLKECY